MTEQQPDVSVVIVSFNTCALLRECILTLKRESGDLNCETIVVDNASRDGSADMIAQEFPEITLIRSDQNLGFAAANNLGFAQAHAPYVVLLNSDAFVKPEAMQRAVAYMQANPRTGLAGAKLVGRQDEWQPSARMFPSLLNHFLMISGLSGKYRQSKFFGRVDRTWADPEQAASVDWVPGAFSIVRRDVLEQVQYFDERFFLYYEEVDLCRRIRNAGYDIWYLPDVEVVHIGGESSRTVGDVTMSERGAQINLWQMRSALMYFYKHHGNSGAWQWLQLEKNWHRLRAFKNKKVNPSKAEYAQHLCELLDQAWLDTQGGKESPPRPW